MDQTRYITKTHDHESMDSKMAILLSRVCAFCEEEGHEIMNCPFVHFHIRIGIARHVARTLMYRPHEHELIIHVV